MVKLYEISALLTYHVVIAAESEDQALAEVETWEHSWDAKAALIGVSDVEVFDVRDPYAQTNKAFEDEAHVVERGVTALCANCAKPETGTGLCDECESRIVWAGLSDGPVKGNDDGL